MTSISEDQNVTFYQNVISWVDPEPVILYSTLKYIKLILTVMRNHNKINTDCTILAFVAVHTNQNKTLHHFARVVATPIPVTVFRRTLPSLGCLMVSFLTWQVANI